MNAYAPSLTIPSDLAELILRHLVKQAPRLPSEAAGRRMGPISGASVTQGSDLPRGTGTYQAFDPANPNRAYDPNAPTVAILPNAAGTNYFSTPFASEPAATDFLRTQDRRGNVARYLPAEAATPTPGPTGLDPALRSLGEGGAGLDPALIPRGMRSPSGPAAPPTALAGTPFDTGAPVSQADPQLRGIAAKVQLGQPLTPAEIARYSRSAPVTNIADYLHGSRLDPAVADLQRTGTLAGIEHTRAATADVSAVGIARAEAERQAQINREIVAQATGGNPRLDAGLGLNLAHLADARLREDRLNAPFTPDVQQHVNPVTGKPFASFGTSQHSRQVLPEPDATKEYPGGSTAGKLITDYKAALASGDPVAIDAMTQALEMSLTRQLTREQEMANFAASLNGRPLPYKAPGQAKLAPRPSEAPAAKPGAAAAKPPQITREQALAELKRRGLVK